MKKAYASYFVSYLLLNQKNNSNINKIILFGSVAKNQANKESDVDIFIDIIKKSKTFENQIQKILNEFYKSREAILFKTKGIDNKINLIIGKLNEWKDIKKSIESTGIILYGQYFSASINKNKKYALISWDKIGKNRGAFLNKVYGVKINKKHYSGIIEQFHGKKIGKSSVMLPIEYKEKILDLLDKYKVNAKIIEIYRDN